MAARDIGHVRWFKPRKRWYIDLYHEGKRHHIYSYQGVSFKQKDYAEDVLTLIRGEIATGTFDIRKYKKGLQLTVRVYAEKWVETLDLAPTTITDYEVSIRRYIGPFFQNHDIRDVRHHHLMEFKNWMSKRRQPKGVYNVMGCLKTILKYAWKNGDIKTVPPFPSVEYTRPAIKWIDRATQEKIIGEIPAADRHIFKFMEIYGTRPGEARALQKSDIADQHIIIRHSFSINQLRKPPRPTEYGYCPGRPNLTHYLSKCRNESPRLYLHGQRMASPTHKKILTIYGMMPVSKSALKSIFTTG
jgi:integrase